MVSYDPDVIQKYADRLYAQSRWVVIRGALLGALAGVIVVAVFRVLHTAVDLARPGQPPAPLPPAEFAYLGALIGTFLGAVGARDRAFALRLQAQTALCQLQIERNTRPQPERVKAPTNAG